MPNCTRPDAANYGQPGPCYFLVRKDVSGVTIEEQRIITTDGVNTFYFLLGGTPVAGNKVKVQAVLTGVVPGDVVTINVSYTVLAGNTLLQIAAAVLALIIAHTELSSSSVDAEDPALTLVSDLEYRLVNATASVEGTQYECHAFEEVEPTDKSLTMSWYPSINNWMFFHDYSPSVYFRDKIDAFCLDSNNFYRMNKGSRGLYTGARKPFIIDIVFRWEDEVIIDHVMWQSAIAASPFSSFTHITVSTREHSTGRVAIAQRRVAGWFAFNRLRDVVITLPFKDDVYNNFDVMSDAVDSTTAWFKRGLLEDNYCIVRLEYDGSDNIVFLGADTLQQKAFR